jgi:hypothetical protein
MDPSGQGTVVLTIGAGIGALLIHTPGSLHGGAVTEYEWPTSAGT